MQKVLLNKDPNATSYSPFDSLTAFKHVQRLVIDIGEEQDQFPCRAVVYDVLNSAPPAI